MTVLDATGEEVMTIGAARELADGDVVVLDGPSPEAWEVLHTPGHAPGHVCLYERAHGRLVAGDMVEFRSESRVLQEHGRTAGLPPCHLARSIVS